MFPRQKLVCDWGRAVCSQSLPRGGQLTVNSLWGSWRENCWGSVIVSCGKLRPGAIREPLWEKENIRHWQPLPRNGSEDNCGHWCVYNNEFYKVATLLSERPINPAISPKPSCSHTPYTWQYKDFAVLVICLSANWLDFFFRWPWVWGLWWAKLNLAVEF
jgi:hypothetical protein